AAPPSVATAANRPRMVDAAFPPNCWKVMLRQSDPKWVSSRGVPSPQGPAATTSRASTGSRPATSSVAASTAAASAFWDRPGSVEGERRAIAAPYRCQGLMEQEDPPHPPGG